MRCATILFPDHSIAHYRRRNAPWSWIPGTSDRKALSRAFTFFRHEIDEFLVEAKRVIALNPNNPTILSGVGLNLIYAGAEAQG